MARRVVTSCFGRFHIFDQAAQLSRLGLLHRLITATPAYLARKWGLPRDKVESLTGHFALAYAHHLAERTLPGGLNSALRRLSHNAFSATLAKLMPAGTEVFIGLSSFSREALVQGRRRGIHSIVDHGSLHEASERAILLREAERYGFRLRGNCAEDWLVEKEDEEFRTADFIFVLSTVAKRTLVDNGINTAKIFVNHCGVSLEHFGPTGKGDDVFRIIQCSSLIPRKGVHYLLTAFHELRLPRAELWLIGSDRAARSDPEFYRVLRRYAGPNVQFKGARSQPELRRLFSQGSLFVLPSLADGFGLVVTQAMACGLPVIVTDMTGAADLVQESRNGFVVPAGDLNALKEKILFLYENQQHCKEMGRAARSIVQQNHTWNAYGDRLGGFLESLPCST